MAVNNAMVDTIPFRIAMLSIHSSPIGALGTQNTGGMSVYVREVAKWIGAAGHPVDIFTYSSGSAKTIDLYPNVRLVYLTLAQKAEIPKENLPDHLPAISRALVCYAQQHQLKYDVIHSHYWLSGVVGDRIQQRWGCPHLTMFHTLGRVKNKTTTGESEPDRRISHELRLVDAVQGIVVPSMGEKNYLERYYDAPSDKVSVIPCGVNMDRFVPMAKNRVRSLLKMDDASLVVLYVGRFAPVKGMEMLLEAVAELVPRYPGLKLVVVGGDGPQADSTLALQDLAGTLGVASHLRLAGRVEHDDLPLYYNAADLLALPSFYESFGLVTLESLACGTPVAATLTGGARSIINEGVNGTLIHPPDAPSIAQGLERMLIKVQQQSFSTPQIRKSVAAYGWDMIAASILNTYETLPFSL
jgi:D-inositol-3-phosphate glycosyltransferase